MIYVDTSVLLARLLAEGQAPPDTFWGESLVSSRLAEYETWNRLHARRLEGSHGEAARALLGRLALAELAPQVLARALEPFPSPMRTLDALHLATADFLRERDPAIRVATYDERLAGAARKMKFPVIRP
ncbi:MAG: PIN domain-containing protein [Planctomycetes bacterium]|nr:PIN domain-containing protein [Planctomycetota bacterium]